MILNVTSHARAGLLGNPSDGYYGKTISFTMRQFGTTVTMYESPEVQLLPADVDDAVFQDLDGLVEDVRLYGYYGGIRLLKATAKVFWEYCQEQGLTLPARNFTVRYQSNIPRLVGLSGSSAICTAMFKALMEFYEVEISRDIVATLCWRAENEELNITCGMQDRVIQMYDGCVYMDFNEELFKSRGYGDYKPIPLELLPRLYVSYAPQRAEVSGVYHRRLRVLFEERNVDILAAMGEFADLARQGYEALMAGKQEKIPALMDANYDLRHRVFHVSDENHRMVTCARQAGASAKFTGSGGAIVGTYEDDDQFDRLCRGLAELGCRTFRPEFVHSEGCTDD